MLQAGTKFGRYTVVRTLGAGGMGAVYLVRHDVLDAYFALKVLSSSVAARDAQFIPRFLREAKLCCRIKHPNLVSVHDAGRDDATGLHYLVMDYAPGGNLREMLDAAGGPLEHSRALKIARELASALVTAAEFGLVHRDIKPENIMFGQEGEAKLADLGVAKSADDSTLVTMENAVFGTPAYMSPEQACDSGKVDARADIYSLGIVLFEMLSGRRPYDGASSMNIIAKLLSREPVPDVRTFAPDVSEELAAVVRDMCAKDAAKRIPSARELLNRLDSIAGCKTNVMPAGGKRGINFVVVLSVVVGSVVVTALAGTFVWVSLMSREVSPSPPPSPPPQLPVVQQLPEEEPPTTNPPAPVAVAQQPADPKPEAQTPPAPEVVQSQAVERVSGIREAQHVDLGNVEPDPVKTKPAEVVVESPSPSPSSPEPARPQNVTPTYMPLKRATVIRPVAPPAIPAAPEPAPSDPVIAGQAVVIGGGDDDASAVKARLGVQSFQTTENSSRLAAQLDDICARRPSRVYIKLGSDAAKNGTPKDIFDNRIRSVADHLRDKGVDFQFVLEDDSRQMRPYNDVVREVCGQKSYDIFSEAKAVEK